jgi:hypothetical protein
MYWYQYEQHGSKVTIDILVVRFVERGIVVVGTVGEGVHGKFSYNHLLHFLVGLSAHNGSEVSGDC